MAVTLFFLTATILSSIDVTNSDCIYGCVTGCTDVSIGAYRYAARSFSCNDGYLPTLTSLVVNDADDDNDGFTVTVMDGDNYQKLANGQSYSYTALVGTGPDKSATCYQSGTVNYRQAAGTGVYIVISCSNWIETCNLKFRFDSSCTSTDPCTGVFCNNGYCSGGRCLCNSGYSGTNCEVQDPCDGVNCNNGHCSEGQCKCDPGYSGSTCTTFSSPFNGNIPSSGVDGKWIAIISGSVGAFLIVVIAIAAITCRRSRRRREEILINHEVPHGEMKSDQFTATT